MILWRFATGADLDRFYGARPEQTGRVIAILQDDEPVTLFGLVYCGDHAMAFSDVKPEFAPCLKSMTVLRAIKAAQTMFDACLLPVFALKTTNNGILPRLGFVPTANSEVYRWANGRN